MTKERQMQVRKLSEQQSIKPAGTQPSADTRITALEVNLALVLNPRRVLSRKQRGRLPKNQHRVETEGILQ